MRTIFFSTIIFCLFFSSANSTTISQYDNDGRLVYYSVYQPQMFRSATGSSHSRGGRPAGCPTSWCGCWLSIHLFGSNKRELWLARNWLNFPRTSPSVGSIAVIGRGRGGHVGVVVGFDSNRNPILKSGNFRGGVGTGTFSKNTVIAYVRPR